MDSLGTLLPRVLRDHKLSQRAFADLLGVDRSAVSHWIRGRRAPPYRDWQIWCDAIGIKGEMRGKLRDAMAVAASPERVREIILELERRARP